MADTKISALPSATTPLTGTETLPIVQSSTTKKVSVDNLTTGRDVSMKSAMVGSGGTTSFPTSVTLNGTNNAGNGSYILGQRNSVNAWIVGDTPVALGSGSGLINYIYGANPYYVYTNGVLAFTIDSSQNTTFSSGNLIQGTAAKGVNFTANTPSAGMTSQLLNWYEEGTWTPNQGAGLTLVGAFSSTGTFTRIGRQVFIQGSVSGTTSVAVASAGNISTNLPYSAAVNATGAAINATNNASSILSISSATITAVTAIVATATITFSAVYTV